MSENIKKENEIIEYVNTYCQNKDEYKSMYMNIHNLSPVAATTQNKKLISDILVSLVKQNAGRVFSLLNHDLVLIYNIAFDDELAARLVNIKFLLNADEKVKNSTSLEECGIVVFYNLLSDLADFSKKIVNSAYSENADETSKTELPKKSFFNTDTKIYKEKMNSELLAKVQKIISVADFSSFIRRQAICAVIGKSPPQRVFEEVFVSIPDMRDSLLPNIDITSNTWLFLALTEILDKRVLEVISRHEDGSLSGKFSVNINVSTVLSDVFLRFDESINVGMKQSIVLEMQPVDIFSDIRSFILAKTFAKAKGYKICIDGITVDQLKYLKRQNLDCDLMKIAWHPQLEQTFNDDKHFMNYINKAERAKIILCRVDDTKAIELGNSLGINLYQGRYVQRLLSSSNNKK